ncbi:MAG: right-handed parallel beta-helix repeat-containing protein [Verrucomicrobia bacterium]|nr:right-handed parallel beta-helix repeat-containing protein [Prolixibacteraceae bacterium]
MKIVENILKFKGEIKPILIDYRLKLLRYLLVVSGIAAMAMQETGKEKVQITLSPSPKVLMTTTIQKAIDSCAQRGGGVVVFTPGTYLCGGIQLRSKVALQLEKGALLQGSDKYSDYSRDAFMNGKDLTDVTIRGEGIIDGVDCVNPKGEEGFRGPHGIRLANCRNIVIDGITIKNSANWAINCRHCSDAIINKVIIRGGHDGLHTRFCEDYRVTNCDFRTGDDAFAGNDNRNFIITDCKINTSCNGFRMGCYNFTVKRCQLWGPGESVHKIQKRNNMLSAFVHFSPKDEHPKMESGNWLIEDCTIDQVDQVYVYNYKNGLWQTGKPVTKVQFKKINATGILGAFNIQGDSARRFHLYIEDSSFSFREGADYKAGHFEGARLLSPSLLNCVDFDLLRLKEVTFSKKENMPLLNCQSGNSVTLEDVNLVTGNVSLPYSIERVGMTKEKKVRANGQEVIK